jgi:hypothetical protein
LDLLRFAPLDTSGFKEKEQMAKLFLLRPNEGHEAWNPWYDKCFGMVIRAENEALARSIASAPINHGDEGDHVWLDHDAVTCTELTNVGPIGLIIQDYHHG